MSHEEEKTQNGLEAIRSKIAKKNKVMTAEGWKRRHKNKRIIKEEAPLRKIG